MNIDEILALEESNRVEKTAGFGEPEKNHLNFRDKLCKNLAAFANDISGSGKEGYFIIGIDDKTNQRTGLSIIDKQMRDLITDPINSHGNIQPNPSITIVVDRHETGDIAIVTVKPSVQTPVRFKKTIYIRRGASVVEANPEDERILIEKSVYNQIPFESQPCNNATIDDLDLDEFKQNYLPLAVSESALAENNRSIETQLASLGFWNTKSQCPTNLGVLCFGKDPQAFLPMAYIQYVVFQGDSISSDYQVSKEIKGTVLDIIGTASFLIGHNVVKMKMSESGFGHERKLTYPFSALREVLMNAILHRDYATPAPIRLYVFTDHLFIENPGGYMGSSTAAIPLLTRYRNSRLGEVLKNYGFVERFGVGMQKVLDECEKNGNSVPEFDYSNPTYFKVTIRLNTKVAIGHMEQFYPSVVFFNNTDDGLKSTSLYHVAWTLADLGYRVLVADYDPQSNITKAFLSEDEMERCSRTGTFEEKANNIYDALNPIETGKGMARYVNPYQIEGNFENEGQIYLLPGHIGLSKFEALFSDAWSRAIDEGRDAFEIIFTFRRIAYRAAESVNADYILIDVASNLGAINRCIVTTTHYLIFPLVPDLITLLGLEVIGPVLREWRIQWDKRQDIAQSLGLFVSTVQLLPLFQVRPLGYVLSQHNVRNLQTSKSFINNLDRIGTNYVKHVLDKDPELYPNEIAESQIGLIKNYHSLIPMAQNIQKPIFKLSPADGAIGTDLQLVREAGKNFQQLTNSIIERINAIRRARR